MCVHGSGPFSILVSLRLEHVYKLYKAYLLYDCCIIRLYVYLRLYGLRITTYIRTRYTVTAMRLGKAHASEPEAERSRRVLSVRVAVTGCSTMT